MFRAAFLRLADILTDPMLLITRSGTIEAINRAGRAVFPDVAAGSAFADLFLDESGRGPRYLRDCVRVRHPLPAAFVDVTGRAWRVQGARYADDEGGAAVVLRLEEESRFTSKLAALNKQIIALQAEMRSRRLAEAALRQEREWLRVTLMSIGDAVAATDVEGRVVFLNPVAQALTGWRTEEAEGKPIATVFRIINEESREVVEDPVEKVLREGRAVGLANHTILIARDGAEWPIDDSAAPIFDEHGEVVGVVLVFHEIVERRQLDRLQRHRIRDLERESRLKDEFLAMLAHELRNPLAPLLTAAELLAGKPPPPMVARVRGVLDRQVRQLSRLVDDLLDVSRITRGRVELRPEKVDVPVIVEAAVETVRPMATERKHGLRVQIPEDLPPIRADPVRLEQVMSNLLTNAVKYTPAGGRITVEARCEVDLVLVVRDTGVGIPADLLAQVFDPFVQGGRSLDRSEGGLGIGLTLVKHLVELHGGSCSVHSEGRDRGTEITVRLPLGGPETEELAPAPPSTEVTLAPGLRVLVVDDHRDAADLLAEVLAAHGCVVSVAYDGPAALERALIERPDVALLDIGLPGMDGYELARRIRRAPQLRDCLLVALTGYGQEADRERSAEAGFSSHLLKPIDPAALRRILAAKRH